MTLIKKPDASITKAAPPRPITDADLERAMRAERQEREAKDEPLWRRWYHGKGARENLQTNRISQTPQNCIMPFTRLRLASDLITDEMPPYALFLEDFHEMSIGLDRQGKLEDIRMMNIEMQKAQAESQTDIAHG